MVTVRMLLIMMRARMRMRRGTVGVTYRIGVMRRGGGHAGYWGPPAIPEAEQ
jgi:hypothetical protein